MKTKRARTEELPAEEKTAPTGIGPCFGQTNAKPERQRECLYRPFS